MPSRLRLIPFLLAASVAAHAEAAPPVGKPPTVQNSAMDGELFYQLLLGEMSAQGGDPGMGFSLMLDAARKTEDPRLFQRSVEIALQARAGESALQAARAWQDTLPDSREANRFVLQILIAINRLDDVPDALKREVALTEPMQRNAIVTALPAFFARVSNRSLAADALEKGLSDALREPATAASAWTSVGRLRLAAGQNDAALAAARKGSQADALAEGPALLALALMGPGRAEPEAIVRRYLEGGPDPDVRLGYVRALLELQRYAEAQSQIEIVTHRHPDYPEGWLIQGSLQLENRQLEAAQASLLRFLELRKGRAASGEQDADRAQDQAYLGLAQIAEQRKDFAQAEQWLARIDDPDALARVQMRRAGILARQGKLDDALALIRKLPEQTPAQARVKLSSQVQLLRDNRRFQEAYDLLAQATQRNPKDYDLLYDQATLAERLGHPDEMERILRRIIADKPDYHHAYNALGYSLADRGLRLDEARELILKALTFAPDDPFINDSLGWVEFRSGRKAEAQRVLQQAYRSRPDPEIAAHLGEVLWSQGQTQQALAVWREGLRMNADNETLLETMQRLRAKP